MIYSNAASVRRAMKASIMQAAFKMARCRAPLTTLRLCCLSSHLSMLSFSDTSCSREEPRQGSLEQLPWRTAIRGDTPRPHISRWNDSSHRNTHVMQRYRTRPRLSSNTHNIFQNNLGQALHKLYDSPEIRNNLGCHKCVI